MIKSMKFSPIVLALAVSGLVPAANAAMEINQPAKNPYLTDSIYPTSHHNPAQTDATTVAGPLKGKTLTEADVKRVPTLFNS